MDPQPTSTAHGPPGNAAIAARLRRFGDLLDAQGADGFRVRAYRNAADEIDRLDTSLEEHFRNGGIDGLVELRGIGESIASAIAEMLTSGTWRQLDRLEGGITPENLFATIPGVGPVLAERLTDTLDVDTLEELEAALRLGDVPVEGVGPRRREAILAGLGQRLARLPRLRRERGQEVEEPPVSLLLDADELYREKAGRGELRRIAPRRFNPTGAAWLPILHARRDGWHLTALYSNTARAHELGRTQDWVVIFFHRDAGPELQRTIVTETRGPLEGRRVVRGREEECLARYGAESSDPAG